LTCGEITGRGAHRTPKAPRPKEANKNNLWRNWKFDVLFDSGHPDYVIGAAYPANDTKAGCARNPVASG